MTQGDEMAEVTEGDRDKAMRAVGYHPSWTYGDLGAEFSLGQQSMVDRIAAALAEERQKARDEVYRELAELAGRQWYVTPEVGE